MTISRLSLISSHLAIALLSFIAGIYYLPILTAPQPPTSGSIALAIKEARYVATIADELTDSDWLHWGKGKFSIGNQYIVFQGSLAPGPDYKMYLSPTFVETEKGFKKLKPLMVELSDVKGFSNNIIPIPNTILVDNFNTVVIWCESFDEFITAAQFKN